MLLSSQSSRETKAASHVLQTVWSYKELRNALTKDGWNKSHFQVDQSGILQCDGGDVSQLLELSVIFKTSAHCLSWNEVRGSSVIITVL